MNINNGFNIIETMKYFRLILLIIFFISACTSNNPEGCMPASELPANIESLTSFGQRAEWSLDGKYVYFVDRAGGEVYRVHIRNKRVEQLTDSTTRPEGHGYYRVMSLSNGDLLLTCGPSRRETTIYIWDKNRSKSPVNLGVKINEGPAVSRETMKIAWTEKQERIYLGEIVYNEGIPTITGKKEIISNDSVIVEGYKFPKEMLEPQSFRPGKEHELIWSMYGFTSSGLFTSETMSYNEKTGEIQNLSNAPDQYDEPEGIFPDGEYTLTECDHHRKKGTGYIDIYKLKLDGNGEDYTRLTYFNETEGFRSSNPVVSDDGSMIAFQASRTGTDAGVGCGLYLMHLDD